MHANERNAIHSDISANVTCLRVHIQFVSNFRNRKCFIIEIHDMKSNKMNAAGESRSIRS